jgi:hypothetical protein
MEFVLLGSSLWWKRVDAGQDGYPAIMVTPKAAQEGFGGNAFKDGYVEAIYSDRITHARGMLLGKVAPREDIPCTRCKLFQDLEKRGKFLSIEDIRNMPFAG